MSTQTSKTPTDLQSTEGPKRKPLASELKD